jgi:hypothetical protein
MLARRRDVQKARSQHDAASPRIAIASCISSLLRADAWKVVEERAGTAGAGWEETEGGLMAASIADLRRYIEGYWEEEECIADDVDEAVYRKETALEAFDALVREAEKVAVCEARIRELEERASQAADLVSKAVELIQRGTGAR